VPLTDFQQRLLRELSSSLEADRSLEDQRLIIHFGSPGGVIPRVVD
jgi:hypothetical protein